MVISLFDRFLSGWHFNNDINFFMLVLVSCAIPEMDEVLCKTNNYYCAGLF